MEDNLLGKFIRSNAVAIVLGALAASSMLASPAAHAQAQAQAPAPAADAPKPEMYGSWGLICPQPKSCQIQVILVNKDKKFVAALAYGKSGSNQTLIGIVPLGFRLQNSPTFVVDNGTPVNGAYVQCLGSGCRVAIPVTDALLKSLQGGKQATLTLLSPANKPTPVNFDLKGFGDAKAALDKKAQ
jgi:invasion protein IalB